ncbi:SMI19 protein, partial [Polypterus senegalus]|nr:SMI19 protein [Polypterus senegalus]
MGGYGVMAEEGTIDYSVHEAWNEATNVYLLVILVSFGLLMYARKNKRKIMRIFSVPPTVEPTPEPNFYDNMQKVRLRQQLEMYYIGVGCLVSNNNKDAFLEQQLGQHPKLQKHVIRMTEKVKGVNGEFSHSFEYDWGQRDIQYIHTLRSKGQTWSEAK